MYRIVITGRAAREIQKLPKNAQRKVDAAIDLLREDPFAGKKLHGDHAGMRSLRIWPYRIIYTIHQEIVTVYVLHIGHRQGVYKK
ncbi:MAG: type II toxin-antitoxin system RelE/ParE family toxin [Candidatus Peribacteraceae bacterium]|nr:type II toxin-antitoxin system RelE/ParE family toxin [Candidatus Peribacteraceae bacterium]MDD5742111.1 type II toxin-antitoxin system RelE/ParE family toxin [Candidatus Peribacteraceae bacterium]